jgi:major membrane immunogen (membrane-anchored lipoprotein)
LRKKTITITITILIIALTTLCVSCSQNAQSAQSSQAQQELQDGYYMAIAADFDAYGWQEYVSIYVNHDVIATVEYNARNRSGFVKSWDMEYMRQMSADTGTYPNEFFRSYISSLLDRQDPSKVDAITGATESHTTFQLLAQAAIEKAKAGDVDVAFVEIPAMQ